jgi:hypothetical protein
MLLPKVVEGVDKEMEIFVKVEEERGWWMCVYRLLKCSAKLWTPPEPRKPTDFKRQLLWKTRRIAVQHVLALYEKMMEHGSYEVVEESRVSGLDLRCWPVMSIYSWPRMGVSAVDSPDRAG